MSDTATETGISSIVLLRSRIALVACMLLLFWASLFALPAIAAFAPKTPSKPANDECLACHNDSTLSKDEGGKLVSLYVNDQHYKASIHSIFNCVDCHTDVKTSPHEATPAKITCAQCHAEQQAGRGLHGQRDPGGRGRVGQVQNEQVLRGQLHPGAGVGQQVRRGQRIPRWRRERHGERRLSRPRGAAGVEETGRGDVSMRSGDRGGVHSLNRRSWWRSEKAAPGAPLHRTSAIVTC